MLFSFANPFEVAFYAPVYQPAYIFPKFSCKFSRIPQKGKIWYNFYYLWLRVYPFTNFLSSSFRVTAESMCLLLFRIAERNTVPNSWDILFRPNKIKKNP